ncbi:MAG: hypothetical protein QF767_16265, partial [Alphaproteobacteria bacterium]|nr:hypothetical protein [Alphaproteobacteria bacterium]
MVMLIPTPTIIQAAGNKPKVIREYVGRVNSATGEASVAHMTSPAGWEEPGQTPEFDEYTLVLAGTLRVTTEEGDIDVAAGQAVIAMAIMAFSMPGPRAATKASARISFGMDRKIS